MKRHIITLIACSIFLIFASSVRADEDEPSNSKFSGMILAGGVGVYTKSLLDQDSNNDTIYSLNEKGNSFDNYFPIISFDFQMKINSDTKAYVSTMSEDNAGITSGVIQALDFGKLDVYGSFGFNEVWEDPYITDVPRTKTDFLTYSGGFKLHQIMGTALGLSYKFSRKDVDEDLIGNRFSDLKRDGSRHKLEVKYGFQFGNGWVTPNVDYTLANSKGDANSYDKISAGLSYRKLTQKYLTTIGFNCGYSKYDKMHPIFLKDREDVDYGVTGSFSWFNPFQYDKFFITLLGGVNFTESNIDFYDEDRIYAGIAIGYLFNDIEEIVKDLDQR